MNQGQPMTPTRPAVSKWLWIVLIIVLVLAAGFFVWYYLMGPGKNVATSTTTTPTPTTTASTSGTTATTTDKTAGWKTYTDSTYGLSFKYPKDWPTATAANQEGVADYIPVGSEYISFGQSTTKYLIRSVQISKISDYAGTDLKASADKIVAVYTNKSAANTGKLLLPPLGASVMAASTPQYIETTDKVYRGIYYFANIGQDVSTGLDAMIIMTDGTKNIIQFQIAMTSDKAAQYQADIEKENNPFIAYVQGLTTSSTETIVTEFNTIYKLMALSLKTL